MTQDEKKFADQILTQLAAKQGTTPAFIRKEISKALMVGMFDPNPAVQAQWKRIPHDGEIPTVEEVLIFLIGETMK